MMPGSKEQCLSPETVALLAEGNLKRNEIAPLLAHVTGCRDCRTELALASETIREESAQRTSGSGQRLFFHSRWLSLAAAAAVAVAILIPIILWQRTRSASAIAQLAGLASRSARTVEPRLAGGFAWAPFRGAMRSTESESEAQRMKLIGATGDLVERADADRSPAAQHLAGLGLLLIEKPEEAITRLHAAAEQSSNDARSWSDLAAAEYMTALRLGRASLYPAALDHADHALRIDPRFAEALFNRALILERLGLTQFARRAWSRYLQIDQSSPWANEAREHLKRLSASTGATQFKRDQPLLERAAARGDQSAVDAIVDRYRQQCRAWGEAEYLGRWAEAEQRSDGVDASYQLASARAIGDSLLRLSGESMLHDAVAAIDHSSPAQRAAIANAHAAYRRGRLIYSREQPAAAEPDLRQAAVLFESARDPMSLVARYYAANTRFDQNDVAGARRELEALREETALLSHDRALGAHIRWELALCTMIDDDWSATASLTAEAEKAFRDLGESSNLAFMQTMRATSLISLGRADEGWALRAKAFEIQSAEARGDRLLVSISDAGNFELRSGRTGSARALLAIEEAAYRASGDNAKLSNALVRQSLIGSLRDDADGDAGDAASAREAMIAAKRVDDPALRTRAIADANFANGVVALHTDPRRARTLLTTAIDDYRASHYSLYLAEAHLMRAHASMRIGERQPAMSDLEEGIEEADRHRARVAGTVMGSGVIDARRALFDEIIPLRLDRGDLAGAFADVERSRRRLSFGDETGAPDVKALRAKLAGCNAAVLELVVLPREIVALTMTASGITASRHNAGRDVVTSLAARNDDDALSELFDLLIRPSSLTHARPLIIVADAALQSVPFAALYDVTTKHRLIEMTPVAMALSASALQPAQASTARPSVVAMALPSGEGSGTVALPEEEAELGDVSRFYARSTRIESDAASLVTLTGVAARADVIHIAGHTERRSNQGDAALLFRGRGTGLEPVTWSRIAEMKLGQPVIVLAACDTLRTPASSQSRALSLGGGFLAAGASSVIGTLTPIPDDEARAIFRSVHRELSRGRGAAVALQQALIEAISEESHGRRSAWQAVALLTSRIERSL